MIMSMLASERLKQIVQFTIKYGFVKTEELANQFDVTETTIRRDCAKLEKNGLLIRVHGGVKAINQKLILSTSDEVKITERIQSQEKERVCQRAASLVHDGDCVFLDGGSSIVSILKYLEGKDVKVVTHSALIAQAFDDDKIDLFVLGGKFLSDYAMSVGSITLSEVKKFNFDHAFISCAGVDLEKRLVYTAEMDTMLSKQEAMKKAVNSHLLCDSSKFKVKGFCSFINSDDFDSIICDRGIDGLIDVPDNVIFV